MNENELDNESQDLSKKEDSKILQESQEPEEPQIINDDKETKHQFYDTSSKQESESKEKTNAEEKGDNKQLKTKNYSFIAIIVLIFLVVLSLCCICNLNRKYRKLNDNINNLQISTTVDVKNSIDISEIVDECIPSVVSITNQGTQKTNSIWGTIENKYSSSGSGIIVKETDSELLIVTNYHVASNADTLLVYFSDNENGYQGLIKGYDSQKDLAVLSVDKKEISENELSNIKIARLGDSNESKVGEQVVAIGNAMGYGQSVTTGILSAKDREVTVNSNGLTITNKLLQTDAAINPGNSGGALINMAGEVIGINSVKFMSEEVEGMGYAIPISDVKEIINSLSEREIKEKATNPGYMGIQCVDVTYEVSQTYDLPIGIYINHVEEDSSAEIAGLKKGDIIVKFAGNQVSNYSELQDIMQYYNSGDTVDIVVKNADNGEYVEKTLSITLMERPE